MSIMLHLIYVTLNQVTLSVQMLIILQWFCPVGTRRYHRRGSHLNDALTQSL